MSTLSSSLPPPSSERPETLLASRHPPPVAIVMSSFRLMFCAGTSAHPASSSKSSSASMSSPSYSSSMSVRKPASRSGSVVAFAPRAASPRVAVTERLAGKSTVPAREDCTERERERERGGERAGDGWAKRGAGNASRSNAPA